MAKAEVERLLHSIAEPEGITPLGTQTRVALITGCSREYVRQVAQRLGYRAERSSDMAVHGLPSMYARHGCQCGPCCWGMARSDRARAILDAEAAAIEAR